MSISTKLRVHFHFLYSHHGLKHPFDAEMGFNPMSELNQYYEMLNNLQVAMPLSSPVSSPSTPSRTYNREEISLTQLLSNVSGCSHMQPTNPTHSTSPRVHFDVTLFQNLKTPIRERQHTTCSSFLTLHPSTNQPTPS